MKDGAVYVVVGTPTPSGGAAKILPVQKKPEEEKKP